MKNRIVVDMDNTEQSAVLFKALASPVRLEMLKSLIDKPANISELAERFSLPLSSAALHVRVLEEAGLIFIQEKRGIRGSQKICAIFFEDLYLNLAPLRNNQIVTRDILFRMPLGNYFDCSVSPPCGIAGSKGPIGIDDASSTFYNPARTHAQLIWFTSGYLEYRFGTMNIQNKNIRALIFSFEVCSEAAGYNNDWPSDITVWVNGKELYRFRSAGDFGGRRGLYSPPWWSENSSQYGELHHLEINESGSYGDGIKCSDLNLETLHIAQKDFISFKIGVKEDAEYVGGINIFGEHFGNYNQNIEMVAKLER
ncbi:MAG: helix-turn-helix domain-containing protein [Treponema sp.]|jgi:predicted transcriptional regulator|nr:helix-turn-helix domain-containing protein [Treponema sp.]